MSDNGGMADGYSSASVGWVPGRWPTYGGWDNNGNPFSAAPVTEAAQRPAAALTSDELANEVESFIARATERVRGIGALQYDQGGEQRSMVRPLREVCEEAVEELLDVAAYAAMLAIRLRRIKASL